MQPVSALTLALTVKLQQKAATQFTNVYEYLPKSGPIPFEFIECPLAGALKAKKNSRS